MEPKITDITEESGVLKFTLYGINVSLANALRRTILSDIDTFVFYTETYNDNKCNIQINTTRFHNEIVKQRLSCIPIHCNIKYLMELDVKNDTDNIMYVTTEHFKLKTENGYLPQDEVKRIFPPNEITGDYIDFLRLRPKISDSIPGEHIKLSCPFSISNAKQNSMFNVVSKCTYANTPDHDRIKTAIDENDLSGTKEEIVFQKRNFLLLDAQRIYIDDSFDFQIQSIGVYSNQEIVRKGCEVLFSTLKELIELIDSDTIPIINSEASKEYSSIDNSYDIVIEYDYTIGKIIEYILHQKYFIEEKTLTYCGFKKYHPHNTESIIRIAFSKPVEKHTVSEYIKTAAILGQEIFQKIYKLFK